MNINKPTIVAFVLVLPFLLFIISGEASAQSNHRHQVNYTWFFIPNELDDWSWGRENDVKVDAYYDGIGDGKIYRGGTLGQDTIYKETEFQHQINKLPSQLLHHKFAGAYANSQFPLGSYVVFYTDPNEGTLVSYENLGRVTIHYFSTKNRNPFKEKNVDFKDGLQGVDKKYTK